MSVADVLENRARWFVACGDATDWLRTLPDDSVHCWVTSPPYYGLRDYGTARWEGGDPACDHRRDTDAEGGCVAASTLRGAKDGQRAARAARFASRACCARCGAERADRQIGLEPTPAEYVARVVEVFRDVRRATHPSGTVWLNLGDRYATTGPGGGSPALPGVKPKDLMGLPWRVAFALQQDGWYLRQDLVWHKPNPVPSSVRDRCTTAHEYLFLLAKAPRYFFDARAVAEPARTARAGSGATANKRSVWTLAPDRYRGAHPAAFPRALVEPCVRAGTSARGVCPACGEPWVRRTGWEPGCGCPPADPIPAVVGDVFAGSGTVAQVAVGHGRRFIGAELNPAYHRLIHRRLGAAEG
mgnify:CR=1 FL=1